VGSRNGDLEHREENCWCTNEADLYSVSSGDYSFRSISFSHCYMSGHLSSM